MLFSILNIKPNYRPKIKTLAKFESKSSPGLFYLVKKVNNRIECDHRRIKRLIKYGLGFHSFKTGCKTIRGYEAMYMIRKGQIKDTKTYLDQVRVIEALFGLSA